MMHTSTISTVRGKFTHVVALSSALLLLGACTPADRPSTKAADNTPLYTTAYSHTANSPMPTRPATEPEPALGDGLYRLNMGDDQWLTCMFYRESAFADSKESDNSPQDIASCAPEFPVRWKLMDGNHEQAAHIIISQHSDQRLDVHASKEPLITIKIVPTEITENTVISGIGVELNNNEALFFATDDTTGEKLEGIDPILLTPDSYEVYARNPNALSPAARVKTTLLRI